MQRRLAELGYLSVSATGVWGPRSRNALRAFKSDHELAADENWDQATERSLFSGTLEPAQPFIGIWGADASACSPRLNRKGLLPAVIDGVRTRVIATDPFRTFNWGKSTVKACSRK